MQAIFTVVVLVATGVLLVLSPNETLVALTDGAANGLRFCVKMYAVYAVWLSVLSLWEKTGFAGFLARASEPLWKRIFPGESDLSYESLSVNLSANFLGMGGAATPAGIRAYASLSSPRNRSMLLVINATSIQLIPTAVVSLRASFGATRDVILPTIIATAVSTALGALAVRLFVRS